MTKNPFHLKEMSVQNTEQQIMNQYAQQSFTNQRDSLTLGPRASIENLTSQAVDLKQAAQELNITLQDKEDEPPTDAANRSERFKAARDRGHMES